MVTITQAPRRGGATWSVWQKWPVRACARHSCIRPATPSGSCPSARATRAVQAFEGLVIAKRGGGISENFTVRKVSAGVGVERMFPIHSPTIATLELVRRGRVRRAKLYYLRALSGKAARIKEKRET